MPARTSRACRSSGGPANCSRRCSRRSEWPARRSSSRTCSCAGPRAIAIPQPVEIENCQDYLLRQVELIQPTVICTLGNFSTKLLRDDPTGITRVHGQPEVLALGRRAVRLYPIFHPAAALYTPRMLETLREDFVRLPELLALGAPEQPQPLRCAGFRAGEAGGARRRRGRHGPAGPSDPGAGAPRSTSWACSRRLSGQF